MTNAKRDAFRDMQYEGFHRKPVGGIDFTDVIDPLIMNGFMPGHRNVFEYIDFNTRAAGLIGSLVLGLNWHKKFPSRWTPDLMGSLCDHFDVEMNYLEGVEAGFHGWNNHLSLPENLLSRDFKQGFVFGQQARFMFDNPFMEP